MRKIRKIRIYIANCARWQPQIVHHRPLDSSHSLSLSLSLHCIEYNSRHDLPYTHEAPTNHKKREVEEEATAAASSQKNNKIWMEHEWALRAGTAHTAIHNSSQSAVAWTRQHIHSRCVWRATQYPKMKSHIEQQKPLSKWATNNQWQACHEQRFGSVCSFIEQVRRACAVVHCTTTCDGMAICTDELNASTLAGGAHTHTAHTQRQHIHVYGPRARV